MPQSDISERNTNGTKLRQRRTRVLQDRILQDKKEDERIEGIIKESIVSTQYSGHMLKTLLVMITALFCTVGALLYNKPNFFNRFRKKPISTFHFATTYPNNMVLERDLPRFFRSYSIATPENKLAQEAVRKVLRSRKQLRRRAGRINTIVKAWDSSNVEQLLNQRIYGDEFDVAYRKGSQERKDELLMWGLIASRVAEGFFMESVDMLDSALFLTRNRGIVVMRQPPAGIADGYGALSTSFYLHPRTNNNTAIDWIPSKVLAMLISSSEEDVNAYSSDIQDMAEKLLYELVVTQGNEKEFLILEEVCQEKQPERSIAVDTSNDADGCYFVVPEKYGGNFKAGVGQS